MTDRAGIIVEVLNEIKHANSLWDTEFDDKNTINDWCAYIYRCISKSTYLFNKHNTKCRANLIKAASLCISAIEAFDRNSGMPKRHYD